MIDTKLLHDRIMYAKMLTGMSREGLEKLSPEDVEKLCITLIKAEDLETPGLARVHAIGLGLNIRGINA